MAIDIWRTRPYTVNNAPLRQWVDRVFDEANEVVLVDLPPDDLLQRMKEGKVYFPEQAARANSMRAALV